jgi:hypothetical protein
VVPDAPAGPDVAQRDAQAASPGSAALGRRVAASATAGAVVVGVVAVVAEAEEPDQEEDEQAHVEEAEADKEDPRLRGHAAPMVLPGGGSGESISRGSSASAS